MTQTQTTYPATLLSQGKKGPMVSVRYAGRTLTRHLSPSGEGRHPDEGLPKLRAKLTSAVAEARTFIREATATVAGIEAQLMDPAADARVKGVQAKRLPALRDALAAVQVGLPALEAELAALPPLTVRYTLGQEAEAAA